MGKAGVFHGVPHADVHCHSLTSVPYPVLRELRPTIPPPPATFASFEAFNSYLRTALLPIVTDIEAVRHLTRAAFQRLIDEGVCYTEMSFDLTVPDHIGTTLDEYCAVIREERDRVAQTLTVCVEAGIDREVDPARSLQLLRQVMRFQLFQSIDLYGREDAMPAETFVELYQLAAAHGLKRKAHVGEYGTAQDLQRAVEVLDLQAVQHGIQAAQCPEVLDAIRERGVVLNVCPQSNLALGLVSSLREHPIRRLLDAGITVTVGSDDYAVFGCSVAEQLLDLYAQNVCLESEVIQLIDNGLAAQFS